MQLQTNNKTFLGRYWTEHSVLRRYFPNDRNLSILSFGCSTGEELVTLRALFPGATLFGCDVDWHNLQAARALVGDSATVFESRGDAVAEHGPYDAIICNSVLMRPGGIEGAQWIDVVAMLDDALRPGGILQVINSNIPFRYHPLARSYEALRSPLILGPHFADQFDLAGRRLCTAVTGTGWSAILNRHLAEDGWRDLLPTDLHDVHFQKAGGRRASAVEDEIIPNLPQKSEWASGTMSYRPEMQADPRPSTFLEVDVRWATSGVDGIRLNRTARRIWFDGSLALTTSTAIDMSGPSATALIESATGRRSSRLSMDALFNPRAIHAPAF
jgi:SAM-dependent methyltransferase